MWKIINKLLLALLTLFFFASCDKEEYDKENTRDGSEKIHFEIAVGKATATPSGVETRVATNPTTYESTFENGDEIGVYIVKGSDGLQSSGNWVDNAKMTYNSGNWTPHLPLDREYYPTDGEKLNFYAYYPYNATVTDALNMNISGLTDQSSATNLSKSDLLSASTLNVGKGSTAVQLAFSHALTMVELKVTSGGAGAEMSSGITVTLEGCKPDVSFNLSTRAANASGNVKSVKMRRVEQSGDADYLTKYTYRALVPTQTVLQGAELFRFSHMQGTIIRALSHKVLPGNAALYPGLVKPYNITLQGASSEHTYSVGDYYPHNGFPIIGVVFEISNEGKNGKVQDLYFCQRHVYVGGVEYGARWGDPTVDESVDVPDIRDWDDGYNGTKNLIKKRKDQPDFASIYSLFNYIYQVKNTGDVNGRWYMPAVNELKAIRSVKNTVNPKIEATGAIALTDNVLYAMTEMNTTYAYKVDQSANHGTFEAKEKTTWNSVVVAIRKF